LQVNDERQAKQPMHPEFNNSVGSPNFSQAVGAPVGAAQLWYPRVMDKTARIVLVIWPIILYIA